MKLIYEYNIGNIGSCLLKKQVPLIEAERCERQN
jgi:hypothetical protein